MAIGSNVLRERLETREVLIGAAVPFFSADLAEWCGLVGFDWLFLDGEHQALGVETCYEMVRAADAVGLATLVRVPKNDPATVLSYAESGVDAVMVPHVLTPPDAARLVSSLRYPPGGVRGALSTSRAAGYGLPQKPAEYFSDTNRHAMAVPLLEDAGAMPLAAEITAVDGVDVVFIGPGDLAMSMGHPGQIDHPEVRDLIDHAVDAISATDTPLGTVAGSAEAAIDAIDRGFRLVLVSLGGLMASATRDLLTTVRNHES